MIQDHYPGVKPGSSEDAQRIQDEQGYVIMGYNEPIIELTFDAGLWCDGEIPCTVRILGTATVEEYQAQALKYWNVKPWMFDPQPFYYKVIAE